MIKLIDMSKKKTETMNYMSLSCDGDILLGWHMGIKVLITLSCSDHNGLYTYTAYNSINNEYGNQSCKSRIELLEAVKRQYKKLHLAESWDDIPKWFEGE